LEIKFLNHSLPFNTKMLVLLWRESNWKKLLPVECVSCVQCLGLGARQQTERILCS